MQPVNQLLYDFGATSNDISKSEALFDAKRAELSSTILDLIYRSVISYINVAAYTIFTNTINDSYERHTAIKQRIEKKLKEDSQHQKNSAELKLDKQKRTQN